MREGYKNTPLGNVPQNWKYGKLSDFVELIHGYQFRTTDFVEDGIPIIKIGNVNNSNLDLDREKLGFIDEERFPSFEQYEIFNEDILMSLTGNIGRVVEVKNLPFRVLQNYRVGKFESHDENILLKKYIKFILSSPLVLNQLFKYANQSAQANFGKQDMDKIKVVIPSKLREQQKIAEILSTVDEKIEAIDQRIAETQELKKGLMQQLLTKGIGHTQFKDSPLGEIPESWEVVNFGELISNHCYGPRFSSKDYSESGNVKTIRGTDINKSGDILYNQVPIAQLPDEFVASHKLKDGDLVMITTADCGLTGVYLDDGFPYIASAYAVRISLNEKGNSYFFKYIFQTEFAKKQVERFIRKGTVANLPGSDILKFEFAIPSIAEQKQIAEILSTVDEKLQIQQDKKAEYQELKKGLMQQLLTGKIRVKI